MPMPAIQRAEKLLLKISADASDIKMKIYDMQDALAKKVNQTFCRLVEINKKVPDLEGSKFAGNLFNQFAKYGEGTQNLVQRGIDILALSQRTQQIDTPKTQTDAEQQLLNIQKDQITNLQQGIQSIAQTNDAALQRLQQIESSAKN